MRPFARGHRNEDRVRADLGALPNAAIAEQLAGVGATPTHTLMRVAGIEARPPDPDTGSSLMELVRNGEWYRPASRANQTYASLAQRRQHTAIAAGAGVPRAGTRATPRAH